LVIVSIALRLQKSIFFFSQGGFFAVIPHDNRNTVRDAIIATSSAEAETTGLSCSGSYVPQLFVDIDNFRKMGIEEDLLDLVIEVDQRELLFLSMQGNVA